MNRRTFFSLAAAAAAAPAAGARTAMGIGNSSWGGKGRDPFGFLEACHALGAGGVQVGIPPADAARKFRARLEETGMYYEGTLGLGMEPAALESAVKVAKEVGALCVRSVCLGGRRYETFGSLEEWKQFVATSHERLRRAIPIFEKHRVRLALENHKDWTAEDFLKILKQYESPYFGACVDTGNNIALLDDALEFVEAFAPYAFSTHIKDMGVAPYEDGFLLSEVPLGEGYVDMKRTVELVRRHHPDTRFTLEMITRNPLKVPCLTDKYWETFPDRNGIFLARTLRTVRDHGAKELPVVDHLSPEAREEIVVENLRKCIAYARDVLKLV